MKKKVIAFLSGIVFSASTLSGCYFNKADFIRDRMSDYSKEESQEYTYKLNGKKLKISGNCSDIEVSKDEDDKSDEITVTLEKEASSESPRKAKKELDRIKCTFDNNELKIGNKMKEFTFFGDGSKSVKAYVKLPSSVNELDIDSSVSKMELDGDYDKADIDLAVGDFSFDGSIKNADISAAVGHIKLNLSSLDSSSVYYIDSSVGDLDIIIPQDSKINLDCYGIENKKIGKNVKIGDDGAEFDIDSSVGNVNISTSRSK